METSRRCIRSIAQMGDSTPLFKNTLRFYNHQQLCPLTRNPLSPSAVLETERERESETEKDELLPNTFIIITRL